ncbi:MAG: chemotaxis protein CheW [Nitrospiraceae bacterium]|nr:chemotaxis protein CheW [Nitrospiraceae bacterium]
MKGKSELILDELKRRKTGERIVEVEEDTVKMVIFSLLGGLYAFPGSEIKEILTLVPMYYVPGSPDFIPGVINVRGDIESVIKINGFLGLTDSKPAPAGRIMIAVSGGVRSGIVVDSVEDVIDVPVSSLRPPLPTLSGAVREYVAGELMYGDKSVTVLDVGKIFGKFGDNPVRRDDAPADPAV